MSDHDSGDLPGLDPSLRELLAHEGTRAAPGGARARALARVTAAIAVGGAATLAAKGASAAGAGAPGVAATGAALTTTAKLLIVGALFVGLGTGSAVTASVMRRDAPRPAAAASIEVPAAPTLAVALALSAAPIAVTTPSALPSVVVSAAPAPRASAAPSDDHSLADERRILDGARSALAQSDTDGAIRAATEHEKRFPHGQLAAEREALFVQALAMANRPAEAKARAARFRVAYPSSVLRPVVDQAVQSLEK